SGVENLEDKIGFCRSEEIKQTTCETFQLSITESNSAPTILSFNSTNQTNRFPGRTPLKFEVIKFDPDEIFPDTNWYVDNILVRTDIGKSKDSLSYEFGCGIFGAHKIRAEITDGLDTDAIDWVFDIVRVNCAEGESPGGTIEEDKCLSELACADWNICQNAAQSAELGSLSTRDLEVIKNACEKNGWSEEFCGFQIRQCFDINQCNLDNNFEFQACYFSLNPTCHDNLQNCHEGFCETQVDCGGPCAECSTCSDGKKSPGEENIDCGGHCSDECPEIIVTPEEIKIKKTILIVIGILVLVVGVIVYFIMREKKKLEKPSPHEKPLENAPNIQNGENQNVKK
ncbi:MAG: hypothetical protein KC506_03855, partial [Nanoarchaeota archaeon]|nr:hypothetical protein [Nanoarchaeota archaeon]